jgi:hypothetical protein
MGKTGSNPRKLKKASSSDHEIESDLRLDIYVIDSGWESLAHSYLASVIDLFKAYLTEHNLYILSRDQSIAFLMDHPSYIGSDPIIVVVDKIARTLNKHEGFGTQLELGLIKDPHRIESLIKMFVRIVNDKEKILDIAHTFRKYNHKEGINGAIDIIMAILDHH